MLRYFLAAIVFWLTLSMGTTRISLDEMPEMGLAETHKTFSEAFKARTGDSIRYYGPVAAKPRAIESPWPATIDTTIRPTGRLRIDRDKEHIK